jgi:hypothetical protein
LMSGDQLRIAGQVIRCCVAPSEGKIGLYEVAFRFDNSADAYIPAASDSTTPGDHEASMVALMVRPDRQTALPSEAPGPASVITSGVHFCG